MGPGECGAMGSATVDVRAPSRGGLDAVRWLLTKFVCQSVRLLAQTRRRAWCATRLVE